MTPPPDALATRHVIRGRLSDGELTAALRAALEDDTLHTEAREPLAAGTYPCEFVDVVSAVGRRSLFVKFGASIPRHTSSGARRGVGYEAEVYRRFLSTTAFGTVPFVGSAGLGEETVLILQALRTHRPLNHYRGSDQVLAAAEWLGRYHAACGDVLDRVRDFIDIHHADDMHRWVDAALELSPGSERAWLRRACRAAHAAIDEFTGLAHVVIHGEYYPINVLFDGADVRPVDWEAAAWAPAELDVVQLTDGWSEDVAAAARRRYGDARWPNDRAHDLDRAVMLATVYLHLRWFGFTGRATPERRARWNLGSVRRAATSLGWL